MFIKKYIVFVLLLTLISCSDSPTKDEHTANPKEDHEEEEHISLSPEQAKIAGVELGTLEKRLMYDVIECAGVIDVPPTERASISAPIEGIVRDVKVIPGTKVRKGEIIAILEHQNIIEMQEKFLKSKAQLTFAKQELDRKEELFKSEAGSKKLFENAKNNFDLAKAQYQSLKKQVQLIGISEANLEKNGISSSISILSPITGFVSKVDVNLGMYVDANFRMFSILNDKHKHIELEVFSSDFDKIEEHQPVKFNITGTQKTFGADIHIINKEVNQATRTIKIHGHLDAEYPQLIVGTQVMAKILTNGKEAMTLPQSAIIRDENLYYAFVKKGGEYEKIVVKTGKKQDDFLEILNAKDFEEKELVIKGAYYLSGDAGEGEDSH